MVFLHGSRFLFFWTGFISADLGPDVFVTNPKVFLGGSASDGVSDEISRMGGMRVSNGDAIYSFLAHDVRSYRSPNILSESLGLC